MAKVTSLTAVYPMDSKPPTMGSDGIPVYDRAYNAGDLREVMRAFITDGVFTAMGDGLAVTEEAGTWSVGAGAAMANGLYIPVTAAAEVIDQSEIGTGEYAYVIVAGRFDTDYRDGAIYSSLSSSPTYTPVRSPSTWELVLARIDWRGALTDYRLDNRMCGPAAPFEEIDTEDFMRQLQTAVSQFNLNVGTVSSLPSGSTPVVTVRKPTEAGGEVYIDFGIPRGAPGRDGADGDSAPTLYVRKADDEPPRVYGNVWMVDEGEEDTGHTIVGLRSYETHKVYPGSRTFPSKSLFPGGTGQWVPHQISADLIAPAGAGEQESQQ